MFYLTAAEEMFFFKHIWNIVSIDHISGYKMYLTHCMCSVVSNFCDPMDSSPPGSSVHGIFQARILEWVAISFSRGSYLSRF